MDEGAAASELAAASDVELIERIWRTRTADGEVLSAALDVRSAGCVACGTCVQACPTGVLHLDRPDDQTALTFEARGCIGCRTCIDLCPVGALSGERSLTWNEIFSAEADARPRVLEKLRLATCSRCGASYAARDGDEGLCPVCAARRKNPFGSSLPPAAWLKGFDPPSR